MHREISRQFADWTGTWHGPVELRDGTAGQMVVEITPIFAGEALEVRVTITDPDGEQVINGGVGYWYLADGRNVRAAAYGEGLGFSMLSQEPDDADTVSLSGPLGGDSTLHTSLVLEDDTLLMSVGVAEGYHGTPVNRTVSRMRRRGLSARVPQ